MIVPLSVTRSGADHHAPPIIPTLISFHIVALPLKTSVPSASKELYDVADPNLAVPKTSNVNNGLLSQIQIFPDAK